MTKFEIASNLNVNDRTQLKNGLTYLSWAWAWAEFKKIYPEATYTVKRFGENQLPYIVDDTGYMVFTEVTADGVTHEMWLPVINYKNQALKRDQANMFDINKSIMRCLTKNLAMFGLGLYIYAGEDLPEKGTDSTSEGQFNETHAKKIASINTTEELTKYWKKNQGLGEKFIDALAERKKALEIMKGIENATKDKKEEAKKMIEDSDHTPLEEVIDV